MKNLKKAFLVFGIIFAFAIFGCSKNNNTIVIYSCGEDYRNEYYLAELQKQFPGINFVLDYQGSGPAAAKLKAEGLSYVSCRKISSYFKGWRYGNNS